MKKSTKELLFERMHIIGGMPLKEERELSINSKSSLLNNIINFARNNNMEGYILDDFSSEPSPNNGYDMFDSWLDSMIDNADISQLIQNNEYKEIIDYYQSYREDMQAS